MFECAFLCVQSAVCQAKAMLSVGEISTVLSGMDTLIGKLVREQKEDSFAVNICPLWSQSALDRGVHKTPEESMRQLAL